MEFWVSEVKSGESLKVSPGDGMVLRLSQANIGELKKVKGNESVCLFVNVDGKKLVLGTLLTDKLPQQQFDLVFEKDFELSHNWKSGSVYFYGYKGINKPYGKDDSSYGEFDDSESEEDVPLNLSNNGKHEPKAKEQKSAEAENSKVTKEKKSDAGKQKVLTPENKNESGDEDSMSGDDDEDDSEDDDDSDDESDESEEETPKKPETSKKRPVEHASKTPVPEKKAKATPQKTGNFTVEPASKTPVPEKKAKATPQKIDGKKGSVHVDTPYPSKPARKTPANKPNQQTPKSGGSPSCKSCNRKFVTEQALESHSKAKHGGGK